MEIYTTSKICIFKMFALTIMYVAINNNTYVPLVSLKIYLHMFKADF